MKKAVKSPRVKSTPGRKPEKWMGSSYVMLDTLYDMALLKKLWD